MVRLHCPAWLKPFIEATFLLTFHYFAMDYLASPCATRFAAMVEFFPILL